MTIATKDPFRDIRKMVESVTAQDPFKKIRELSASMTIRDPFIDIRKILNSAAVKDPFRKIRDLSEIKAIQDPFKELKNTINKYQNTIDIYKNIFKNSVPVNSFEEAYKEVASSFVFAQNEFQDSKREAIEKVVADYNNEIKSFPLSKLSIEFYLNLIIAIVFFLYSLHLSAQSEQKILQAIKQSHNILYITT